MWDWEALLNSFLLFLPRLLTGLVILIGFWVVGAMIERLVRRLTAARRLDPGLTSFLARAAKITLLLLGLLTALGTLGLDVTALVASLGLTGLAIGLAMKDMISNAVSGILLLLYKPFCHGDQITIDPHKGRVIEINLRYTVLDSEDKTIFVPNANLFTNVVTVLKPESAPKEDSPPPPAGQ
ncbi:MAG: mechanosensitive ion channel [Gemmataceae bacterium]|nr:mechanosensitive ion channel [Gemmataceae bacterium]